ncbi:MAG: MBL fold metallo-hydrolase [Verrucomicrobiae bacterium]|nr:MBL fold metallo-hydrolase [Verrucomicrobiae bacterium]
MPCRLTILASGSGGNCAFIESESTRLLVDAGLSARQIEERLTALGRSAAQLQGIIITHEHSDHIQGLWVLARRHRIPIYANHQTREAILETWVDEDAAKQAAVQWKIFENGQRFPIGDFMIEPFSIPHDSVDPVGFLFYHDHHCAGFITDVGHMNHLLLEKMRQAEILVLETNHDLELLHNHPTRPWSLKQRVAGRHGHLSNKDAAAAISQILSQKLTHIFLAHLSDECNRPELAEKAVKEMLRQIGALHVQVTLTRQDQSTQTLEWATAAAETSDAAKPSGF